MTFTTDPKIVQDMVRSLMTVARERDVDLSRKLLADHGSVQGLPRHVVHAVPNGNTEHLTLNTPALLLPLPSHAAGRTVELAEATGLSSDT